VSKVPTRADAVQLDRLDRLAAYRARFSLPADVCYLDGNSLGALPRGTSARLHQVIEQQWGHDLIRSWNAHGWIDLPQRIGAALAPLVGASADEIIVCDSVSVNLFKLLSAALRRNDPRKVILTEASNFPTDVYVAQGLVRTGVSAAELRVVPRTELECNLDEHVAVLLLTHVDYQSAAAHDIRRLTDQAHRAGALVLWDLSHSVGAMPLSLADDQVDFAVGCGYKYLCGGPGAPAFAFVAQRHLPQLESALVGWMGHQQPFAFAIDYRPADGIDRLLCGTPPILSMMALEVGVQLIAEIGITAIREKSQALTEFFRQCVEPWLAESGLRWGSPLNPTQRGSHLSLHHPAAHAIVQALIAQRVIGDFRAPDLVRLGFAAPYVSFVDVWEAADRLREMMRTGSYDQPQYHVRAKVT